MLAAEAAKYYTVNKWRTMNLNQAGEIAYDNLCEDLYSKKKGWE